MLALVISACSQVDGQDLGGDTHEAVQVESVDLSGNVIVSTTGNDAVFMFDSDGNFLDLLYALPASAGQVYGMTWNAPTQEVLVAIDAPDYVVAIDPATKASRLAFIHGQFAGNIRGIAYLPVSQDIVVAETSGIERFRQDGTRVTSGWPLSGGNLNSPWSLSTRASGGFVACNVGGSDVVQTIGEDGVEIDSVVVGGNPYGCKELSDGRIAVARQTGDELRIYSSDLSTLELTWSDTVSMTDPRGVGELGNGNILISDVSYDHIVVITPSGTLVKEFGRSVLNDPNDIVVVP